MIEKEEKKKNVNKVSEIYKEEESFEENNIIRRISFNTTIADDERDDVDNNENENDADVNVDNSEKDIGVNHDNSEKDIGVDVDNNEKKDTEIDKNNETEDNNEIDENKRISIISQLSKEDNLPSDSEINNFEVETCSSRNYSLSPLFDPNESLGFSRNSIYISPKEGSTIMIDKIELSKRKQMKYNNQNISIFSPVRRSFRLNPSPKVLSPDFFDVFYYIINRNQI